MTDGNFRTTTPIKTKHSISVEIFYAVWGQFADGRLMSPVGPGELRMFKRTEGIILPAVRLVVTSIQQKLIIRSA